MSLQFATQKLVLFPKDSELKQSGLGKILFNSRAERDAMAHTILPRLLHVNKLQIKSTLWPKIKHHTNFMTTSKQKQLAHISINNEHHISQAIKSNTTALQTIQRKLHTYDLNSVARTQVEHRLQHRLTHLIEEQSALEQLAQNLYTSEQIVGFMGDGYDTLVEFEGGDTQTFGAHGYAIIKNNDSGTIRLQAVETTQLNESLPVDDAITNGMVGSLRDELKYGDDRNEEIQKIIEAQLPIKPQRSHFGAKLFGQKQTQSTGAEAAGAACCSITSLDELANIGQRTDHDHGEIILPTNGSEAALTGFVTYASAAGIKISADIYTNFKRISKQIDAAEKILKLSQIENQAILAKPEYIETKQAFQACAIFLSRQKSEAMFQKRVAGILSGIGSLSILVGQFVAKVSPIGLYLLSSFGVSHVVHMGRELKKACQDFKAAQPNTAEKHHFYKKIKNLSLAMASWSAYTTGTAILGTMSLGMMGIAITTSAAPALIIAGITALGLGIAGTLIFNNIMTSKRFYPGMPMLSRLDPGNPPTQKEAQLSLKQAQALRKLIKSYRQVTFRMLRTQKPLALIQNTLQRYTNKAGLYTTLGLIPKPFMNNKFNIKGLQTHSIGTHNVQHNHNRLNTLQALFTIEHIKNPALKKNLTHPLCTHIFELEKFNNAKESLEKMMDEKSLSSEFLDVSIADMDTNRERGVDIDTDLATKKDAEKAIRNRHIDTLHHLLDLMENVPKSDQMMKLFSKKVLKQRFQIQTKIGSKHHHGLIGQYIPERKQSTWIKPEYESIFRTAAPDATTIDKPNQYPTLASDGLQISSFEKLDSTLLSALGGLYKTMPCCPAHKFANDPKFGILNEFRKAFTHHTHQSTQEIQKLESLLYQCIDQYLLYQARNNAKEDIALHAHYLTGFENE